MEEEDDSQSLTRSVLSAGAGVSSWGLEYGLRGKPGVGAPGAAAHSQLQVVL